MLGSVMVVGRGRWESVWVAVDGGMGAERSRAEVS